MFLKESYQLSERETVSIIYLSIQLKSFFLFPTFIIYQKLFIINAQTLFKFIIKTVIVYYKRV